MADEQARADPFARFVMVTKAAGEGSQGRMGWDRVRLGWLRFNRNMDCKLAVIMGEVVQS
jgi:hypothetical protein